MENDIDKKDWIDEIDIDKEIVSVRKQDYLFCFGYKTPIEISDKASEYLISNAGKPTDFDELHKKFGMRMDKGAPFVYNYDTLNWHTYCQLRRKGYDYKLLCADDSYGNLVTWRRYILVDKEDKMVYANERERTKRAFNHEFHYYCGARYNSNFEFVADEADDYPLHDSGLYKLTPMSLDIYKRSLQQQKEDITDKPGTETLIKEIDWTLKEIDSVLGQITMCKSDLLYKVSEKVGKSIVLVLEEFKEGKDVYPYHLKDLDPEFRKIEDSLHEVREYLYHAEYELFDKVKELIPKPMMKKLEKKLEKEFDIKSYIQTIMEKAGGDLNKSIDSQDWRERLKEDCKGCIELDEIDT